MGFFYSHGTGKEDKHKNQKFSTYSLVSNKHHVTLINFPKFGPLFCPYQIRYTNYFFQNQPYVTLIKYVTLFKFQPGPSIPARCLITHSAFVFLFILFLSSKFDLPFTDLSLLSFDEPWVYQFFAWYNIGYVYLMLSKLLW